MKKRIEDLLVPALEEIKLAFPVQEGEDIEIPKTFSGSISGFGSAIGQMGLLPALAVYAAKDSGDKDKHRSKILSLITKIAARHESTTLTLGSITDGEGLFHKAIELYGNDPNDLAEFKDILLDTAVALKLALRTFKREGNG